MTMKVANPTTLNYKASVEAKREEQCSAIKRNIHLLEAFRNKLMYNFMEVVHALDLPEQLVTNIYDEFYPHVSKNAHSEAVNPEKEQKNELFKTFLKETSIDLTECGLIFGISQAFNYANQHKLLPPHRAPKAITETNGTSSKTNHPKLSFEGNKYKIMRVVKKLQEIIDMRENANFLQEIGHTRISYISLYLHDEETVYMSRKDKIASDIQFAKEDETEKVQDYIKALSAEMIRHTYAVEGIMSLLGSEKIA